jgi:hypothetical protein
LKQWVNGRHNKWRIFDSPPGYAKTNNPLESFNALIKRDYTKRIRLSVLDCLKMLKTLIRTYSKESRKVEAFIVDSVPTQSMITSATKYEESDFTAEKGYHFLNYKNEIFKLCLRKRRCSCCDYVKYKMCAHLVAASKFFEVPNLDNRVFVYKEKTRKKNSTALKYD